MFSHKGYRYLGTVNPSIPPPKSLLINISVPPLKPARRFLRDERVDWWLVLYACACPRCLGNDIYVLAEGVANEVRTAWLAQHAQHL